MSQKKTNPEPSADVFLAAIRQRRPRILLGVSGGVAAYKAVDLASQLTALGSDVKTAMTDSACRFVMPQSFEAVTRSPVYTSLWDCAESRSAAHISFLDWAELVVVAPATANIIGKAAGGLCDDLLSTALCTCWAKPVLLAPAMNTHMWQNPAVQRNVELLKKMHVQFVGPARGRLACGSEGVGRMAEPTDILQAVGRILSSTETPIGSIET